jgi:hypothetical protein
MALGGCGANDADGSPSSSGADMTGLANFLGTWEPDHDAQPSITTLSIKSDGTFFLRRQGTNDWDQGSASVLPDGSLALGNYTVQKNEMTYEICATDGGCHRIAPVDEHYCFQDSDCVLQCNTRDIYESHECNVCDQTQNRCKLQGDGKAHSVWYGTYLFDGTDDKLVLKNDGTFLQSDGNTWLSGTCVFEDDSMFLLTYDSDARPPLSLLRVAVAIYYDQDWNMHKLIPQNPFCFQDSDCVHQEAGTHCMLPLGSCVP